MKLTILQFSISTAYKIDNIQDSASLRLLKEAEYCISIDLLIRNKNITEWRHFQFYFRIVNFIR